ncbi:hypothetical protein GMST_02180 [Geomonas silvestris]|uniref:ABC-type transport auxiliary lipoprotein component domain-containing protein n=1 Tax=Geomonas silvestris TaxID=2740184 RepID=A0A6V8MDL5_9BACT|nr:PqiC family protein [Geomonas silvestris]GFO57893.1 hypothetical protein GMST_02180 [Geomonas silvestris]
MRRIFFAGALALLSLGCSRSPQVSFYTLEPLAPSLASPRPAAAPPAAETPARRLPGRPVPAPLPAAPPVSSGAEPRVAVGPVTLPELVDRPQLVVRLAGNRVEILEQQRWAEPLKGGIARVVAADLGRLLGPGRAFSYQEHAGVSADYRLLLDVERFEAQPGQGVSLEVAWTLRGAAESTPRTGSVRLDETAGEGYDSLVAAFSRALSTLSQKIADAIMKAPAPPP